MYFVEKDDGYVYFKEIFKGKKDDWETEVGYDEEVKSSFGFVVFKWEELDVKFRFWKVKVEKIRINLISSKSWTHLGKQLYNMEDPGFITLSNMASFFFKNINQAEKVNFSQDVIFCEYINKYKCKNKHSSWINKNQTLKTGIKTIKSFIFSSNIIIQTSKIKCISINFTPFVPKNSLS